MITIQSLSMEEAVDGVSAIDQAVKAEAGGAPIAICVYGATGLEIAALAMDRVLPGSIAIAKHKAYTCIALQRDTVEHHVAQPSKNPANYGDPNITMLGGGVVIKFNDHVVGSIAVSGRKAYRLPMEVDPVSFQDPILTDHELACIGRDAILEQLSRPPA